MGLTNSNKVCALINGIPAIVRGIETYNSCGSFINIVVVGYLATSVMEAVSKRFKDVIYAYQPVPAGTGDAAGIAISILKRLNYNGNVFLVAGDKLIKPNVILGMLNKHIRLRADVTIATTTNNSQSGAGTVLTSKTGEIIGVLEESERLRVVAIHRLSMEFEKKDLLTDFQLRESLAGLLPKKVVDNVVKELLQKSGLSNALKKETFIKVTTAQERDGIVNVCGYKIAINNTEKFAQKNLSTYIFKSAVLYQFIDRLKPHCESGEIYLTDIFSIIKSTQPTCKILTYKIKNPASIMSFNTPEELENIQRYFGK